jgi:hypothetical protein
MCATKKAEDIGLSGRVSFEGRNGSGQPSDERFKRCGASAFLRIDLRLASPFPALAQRETDCTF